MYLITYFKYLYFNYFATLQTRRTTWVFLMLYQRLMHFSKIHKIVPDLAAKYP